MKKPTISALHVKFDFFTEFRFKKFCLLFNRAFPVRDPLGSAFEDARPFWVFKTIWQQMQKNMKKHTTRDELRACLFGVAYEAAEVIIECLLESKLIRKLNKTAYRILGCEERIDKFIATFEGNARGGRVSQQKQRAKKAGENGGQPHRHPPRQQGGATVDKSVSAQKIKIHVAQVESKTGRGSREATPEATARCHVDKSVSSWKHNANHDQVDMNGIGIRSNYKGRVDPKIGSSGASAEQPPPHFSKGKEEKAGTGTLARVWDLSAIAECQTVFAKLVFEKHKLRGVYVSGADCQALLERCTQGGFTVQEVLSAYVGTQNAHYEKHGYALRWLFEDWNKILTAMQKKAVSIERSAAEQHARAAQMLEQEEHEAARILEEIKTRFEHENETPEEQEAMLVRFGYPGISKTRALSKWAAENPVERNRMPPRRAKRLNETHGPGLTPIVDCGRF